MKNESIIKDQTVFVQGDRIMQIGPSATMALPKNSKRIDGSGAYLMPGLADMHIHTRHNWNDWPVSPLRLYLANGVTTIRCFGPKGGDQKYALRWRDKISQGKLIGPTIYASGPILYGPVSNPEKKVRKQIAQGFDFIKLYSFLSKEDFHQAITSAKQGGIYTAGHIPFQVGLDGVLTEGMDEIAHIEELAWENVIFDKNKGLSGRKWLSYVVKMAYQQYKQANEDLSLEELNDKIGDFLSSVATKVQAAKVPVCTTLYLDKLIVEKLFYPKDFLSKPENKYLPKIYHNVFKQGKEKHQVMFKGGEDFALFKHNLDLLYLRYLKASEAFLVLGTDSGTGWMGIAPGFSLHKELRILIDNGFTPYEAIKTGTVNAGIVVDKMIGKGDFGTVEIGKRADLILVKDNPLKDVAHIKNILGVMAAGRWYDEAILKNMIEP